MRKFQQPILIAGGGPAGSSLALRLRMRGLPVTLVERCEFPRQKLCGEFISPECLEHFKTLGVLDEMLASGGERIWKTVFFERGGRSISVPSEWFKPSSFALSLSRSSMDNILLGAARCAGAEVLDGASVIDLLLDRQRAVGVRIRTKDRQQADLPADLVVDATGRARVVARMAERHSSKISADKPRFVAFKSHMSGVRMPRGVCEIYAFRGGYGGLSFVEGGEANLCFIAKVSMLTGPADGDSIFARLIGQNARARSTLAEASPLHDWLAVAISRFGASPQPEVKGLFSIGDSSAFIDPFTGSGMLMALESSEIFARLVASTGDDLQTLAGSYRRAAADRFRPRLAVSSFLRKAAFHQFLSTAAVRVLSTSERLRSRLARQTRPTDTVRSM